VAAGYKSVEAMVAEVATTRLWAGVGFRSARGTSAGEVIERLCPR
jgi:hypothetical protein